MTQEEKEFVVKLIRQETCCGLNDAFIYFNTLLDAIKKRPIKIMDKSCKLKIEWNT